MLSVYSSLPDTNTVRVEVGMHTEGLGQGRRKSHWLLGAQKQSRELGAAFLLGLASAEDFA